MSSELVVISLNLIVLFVAYTLFYPRYCGTDMKKLMIWDSLYSMLILGVCYMLFANKGIVFDMIVVRTTWFWFCISTYICFEIGFFVWYIRKYNLKI